MPAFYFQALSGPISVVNRHARALDVDGIGSISPVRGVQCIVHDMTTNT